jgi:kumamolisin
LEEIQMSLKDGAMRRISRFIFIGTAFVLLAFANPLLAQNYGHKGTVVIPASSTEQPGDIGVRSHTNYRIFVPSEGPAAHQDTAKPQASGPPFPGYFYETPASMACVYGLVAQTPGCNPNVVTTNPSGGSRAIVIVDAFDYPQAASDLAFFSSQFGLAPADFSVVYASGTEPGVDPSGQWEIEESLDIEWAHAMAPNAKIYLVEAASNFDTDLYKAVGVANKLLAKTGGEVSISWGGGEFGSETFFDSYFKKIPGIVYFAASGDGPGVIYPSTSPYVVAAGGTSTSRNSVTGSFQGSTAWQSAGGGISSVEPRPAYQNSVSGIVGAWRGTPDLAFDADPETPVWVFNSFFGIPLWFIVGGTSVSTPSLAGIVDAAGGTPASSGALLTTVYSNLGNSSAFTDIASGSCGVYEGNLSVAGYDNCTGVGAPNGYSGFLP